MSDDEAKETELIEKLVWGHAIATTFATGLVEGWWRSLAGRRIGVVS